MRRPSSVPLTPMRVSGSTSGARRCARASILRSSGPGSTRIRRASFHLRQSETTPSGSPQLVCRNRLSRRHHSVRHRAHAVGHAHRQRFSSINPARPTSGPGRMLGIDGDRRLLGGHFRVQRLSGGPLRRPAVLDVCGVAGLCGVRAAFRPDSGRGCPPEHL